VGYGRATLIMADGGLDEEEEARGGGVRAGARPRTRSGGGSLGDVGFWPDFNPSGGSRTGGGKRRR